MLVPPSPRAYRIATHPVFCICEMHKSSWARSLLPPTQTSPNRPIPGAERRTRTGSPIAWPKDRSRAQPARGMAGGVIDGRAHISREVHRRHATQCRVTMEACAPSTRLRAALKDFVAWRGRGTLG